jgi:hypothetical protein
MLSVILICVVFLSGIILNVILFSAVILIGIKLSVILWSDIQLCPYAECHCASCHFS